MLIAGAVLLTLGEMLKTSAAWQVTYRLAPEGRSAEFFATYGLGRVGAQILGPLLITTVVLPFGTAGWLALAAMFAIAAVASPPIAARALQRPWSRDHDDRDGAEPISRALASNRFAAQAAGA